MIAALTSAFVIFREGAEIVLMLAAAMAEDPASVWTGGIAGAAALLAVGWITVQRLLPRIDIGLVFRCSNIALSALAAWFAMVGLATLVPMINLE